MSIIQTYSGKKLELAMAEPEDFVIEDIAHALSLVNRFGGHTPLPYSVAAHSILCARVAHERDVDPLTMLLHDASEAYIGDLPRYVKEYIGDKYKNLEEHLMAMISIQFDTQHPMTPEMKQIDNDVLETEFRDIVRKSFEGRTVYGKPLRWDISGFAELSPQAIERMFINDFHHLRNLKHA